MAATSFFSTVLAVLQLAFLVAFPAALGSDPIDYGGSYRYGTVGVTEWLTLAQDGGSDYRIVIPADAAAGGVENEAAGQLKDYFAQITGADLQIVPDSETAQEKEICIGAVNRGGPDTSGLQPEGFIKKAAGDRIFLAGKDARGALYAVFSFLEEQLGVRWFTPELTVVPGQALLRVDVNLNDTQQPVFEYRDAYWSVAFGSADWKAHNKVNSQNGGWFGANYGDGVAYADFCHSFDRLLPNSLFDTDETLFSYRIDRGGYTTDQRCLTNPDVLDIMVENIRKVLSGPEDDRIMSVTQNDNQNYCQCDRCEAEAARLGGQSGLMVWFVNQVARALADEFPKVVFDTFAYQYTRKPPTVRLEGENGNVAEPNVCVRLCSIECCFAHPLADCGHERGESLADYVSEKPSTFARDIAGWQDFCQRLYIWDYTTNFLMYLMPFPNFHVLAPNMQYFAANNVRGVFEQGNYTGGKSGEFGEMRAYILAKLLWDPNADVEYHMMDFMRAYYGEQAAPYIKEYLDRLTRKTVGTSHLYIFNWHYMNTFLRSWDTAPMDALWDKAEQAAGTPWQLDNVRRSRLQLRWYKACMLVGEFFPLNPMRIQENKKLFSDILDLGVTRTEEWKGIVEPKGLDWLMTPVEWSDPSGLPWNDGTKYEPIT